MRSRPEVPLTNSNASVEKPDWSEKARERDIIGLRSIGTPLPHWQRVQDPDYSTCGDRDTQTLQAKFDELLRVTRSADSELAQIDTLEPEDIKRLRDET
jgi:hypothetical protein